MRTTQIRRRNAAPLWALIALLLGSGVALAKLFRVSEDEEVKVARQLEREVHNKYRVFPAETAKIGEMSRRLLGAGPWPKKFAESFSFWVIEDPKDPKQLNAFCAPGGFICFYRELYTKLIEKSGEDAVAGVLAHEIEHAANHHSARAVENQMEKQVIFGLLLAATGAGDSVATLTDVFLGLKSLRYSRVHENESDERGIVRLWRAGYDTTKMAGAFELFKSLGKDKPPAFLSTHPTDDTRIARARERSTFLVQQKPGVPLAEANVFHREGKPFIRAGWPVGVAENVVVRDASQREFRVARNVQFDHAELRASTGELPEGATVRFEKPAAAANSGLVGCGTVTSVNRGNSTVTIDLGRWQGVAPGTMFNLVQSRAEDVRDKRGRVERVRTTKTVATARVREVRDRDATLELTTISEVNELQRGMEARLATWP